MIIDLRSLSIGDVCAHPVPLQGNSIVQKLSTAKCTIDPSTRDRIENNLRLSLGKQHLSLRFLPNASTVSNCISQIIHNGNSDLLQVSQTLAIHLFLKQPGSSSPGTILVASAQCNGLPALAIMKLDDDLKVSKSEQPVDGGFTYTLSEIQTLDIDKDKVFKAALFVATTSEDGSAATEIIASDHQVSGYDGKGMADFFLKNFLECEPIEQPGVALQAAYTAIVKFINEDVVDPVDKAIAFTGITAEMVSQDPTLNLDDYQSDFVPEELSTQFEERLQQSGIVAKQLVKVSTEVEEPKYISCLLSTGIRIIGAKEQIMELIQEVETNESPEQIVIKGTIVEYKFRKRK